MRPPHCRMFCSSTTISRNDLRPAFRMSWSSCEYIQSVIVNENLDGVCPGQQGRYQGRQWKELLTFPFPSSINGRERHYVEKVTLCEGSYTYKFIKYVVVLQPRDQRERERKERARGRKREIERERERWKKRDGRGYYRKTIKQTVRKFCFCNSLVCENRTRTREMKISGRDYLAWVRSMAPRR